MVAIGRSPGLGRATARAGVRSAGTAGLSVEADSGAGSVRDAAGGRTSETVPVSLCDGPLEGVLLEAPDPEGARPRVPAVGRDHVSVAGIELSAAALLTEEHPLGAGLQIDDPSVVAGDSIHVVPDHEPTAALVDLALVE